MERIAVTLEDLDILVRLIQELGASATALKGLEQLLVSLKRLVPFEHCIFLHERRSMTETRTYRQEYSAGPGAASPLRVYSGAEMCNIGHCVDLIAKTNTLENAFVWEPSAADPVAPPSAFDSVSRRVSCSHGIGGLVTVATPGSETVTLVLLQHAEKCFGMTHMAVMSALMRSVHGILQKCNEFDESPSFGALTAQEAKVMRWVVEGKTSWEVGMILSISERTVKFHLANIYSKLRVANRVQAVSLFSRGNTIAQGDTHLANAC